MKLNNFWATIIFLFLSCQSITEINLKNTKLIDGVYCHKNGKTLNGNIRIITNDSTSNSRQNWDEVHFVDGVPTGEYKRYEFDDFTSLGVFKVIKTPINSLIRRISIESDSLLYNSTIEVTAYIIVKNKIIIADTSLYYKVLEEYKLNIAEKIDHIAISTGEYEPWIATKSFNFNFKR
jgi:hypothetical protein